MYTSDNDELQNIKISEYQKNTDKYKIKSYVIFTIVMLLLRFHRFLVK